MGLLEKLADDKEMVSAKLDVDSEITRKRREKDSRIKKSLETGDPESKEMVRTLVENSPEETLKQTTLRRKKCRLKRRLKNSVQIKSPGSGCRMSRKV